MDQKVRYFLNFKYFLVNQNSFIFINPKKTKFLSIKYVHCTLTLSLNRNYNFNETVRTTINRPIVMIFYFKCNSLNSIGL